jgi:hypothetical protein
MAFMMNKLAMNDFCEIIVENKNNKNYFEIQVRTILVCALYSIKCGKSHKTFYIIFAFVLTL